MRLSFIAVTTDKQFRDLLIVRNECRDGLTHNQSEIDLEAQKEWKQKCWSHFEWEKSDGTYPPFAVQAKEWYEPYLLYDEEWPIGYGLLKWDGKKYWMTAGLAKGHRGKGLSLLLINYITEMAYREKKEPVWLDAKDENPGMYGYIRAGYEFEDPEVWIDVMDDNPAIYGDIRAGYEFKDRQGDLHVMKHNRERRLAPKELFWMANHGHPVIIENEVIDVLKEMTEVADINNEVYGSKNHDSHSNL